MDNPQKEESGCRPTRLTDRLQLPGKPAWNVLVNVIDAKDAKFIVYSKVGNKVAGDTFGLLVIDNPNQLNVDTVLYSGAPYQILYKSTIEGAPERRFSQEIQIKGTKYYMTRNFKKTE